MKTTLTKTILRTLSITVAVALIGCGKKPDPAAPSSANVQLMFGSFTTAQNQAPMIWKLLGMKEANAAVTSLKMCFKRLRIKADDVDTVSPASDSNNKDFFIGEVIVSNAGASLGAIAVPKGVYHRIEFDLEPSCASGLSMQLTNANGAFTSNERITVKFSGTFTANADGALTLGVQTILNQLNTFNAGTTLKVHAEAVSGVLSN